MTEEDRARVAGKTVRRRSVLTMSDQEEIKESRTFYFLTNYFKVKFQFFFIF